MPTVILKSHAGDEYPAESAGGDNLMNVALENNVPGNDGDCGGACACGTCHVFVPEPLASALPPPDPIEDAMLSLRPDRQPNSRLACQIQMSDALDGTTIEMPEFQM